MDELKAKPQQTQRELLDQCDRFLARAFCSKPGRDRQFWLMIADGCWVEAAAAGRHEAGERVEETWYEQGERISVANAGRRGADEEE